MADICGSVRENTEGEERKVGREGGKAPRDVGQTSEESQRRERERELASLSAESHILMHKYGNRKRKKRATHL